jgi:hypothetical protein
LAFFFYGPFAWITRTIVRTDGPEGKKRLIYELKHPIDLLVAIALCLVLDVCNSLGLGLGRTGAMLPLLYAPLHSGILYFMHREIVRGIAGDPDRGEKLVRAARVR